MWQRLYPQEPHNPLPIFHLSMKIQRVPVTANKEPATADEMTGNHNQEWFILFATKIHTTTATRPGQNDACTSGSFSRRRTSRQIVGLIIEPFPPLHAGPDIFSLYVDKQTATTLKKRSTNVSLQYFFLKLGIPISQLWRIFVPDFAPTTHNKEHT